MEEQLITFKTAKLAKEKGFDVEDEYYYIEDLKIQGIFPTQTILQKWLRDKHQIFVEVNTDCTSSPKFSFNIRQFIGNPKNLSEREWEWISPVQNENWGLDRTYELSLESGLLESLKLIKDELVK